MTEKEIVLPIRCSTVKKIASIDWIFIGLLGIGLYAPAIYALFSPEVYDTSCALVAGILGSACMGWAWAGIPYTFVCKKD